MNEKLANPYETIKAEYKPVQKTLTEMETKQVILQHALTQLNFKLQLQGRGITRSLSTGFMAGGNGR